MERLSMALDQWGCLTRPMEVTLGISCRFSYGVVMIGLAVSYELGLAFLLIGVNALTWRINADAQNRNCYLRVCQVK